MKTVFSMDNQKNCRQSTALATAVLAYAQHIDNPAILESALTRIGLLAGVDKALEMAIQMFK